MAGEREVGDGRQLVLIAQSRHYLVFIGVEDVDIRRIGLGGYQLLIEMAFLENGRVSRMDDYLLHLQIGTLLGLLDEDLV